MPIRLKLGLFVVVTMLIAIRMPDILAGGRFWAEEGRFFFARAWQLPFLAALLATLGGYLNITANIAGLLAWYVPPLAWAPYASTSLAWLFQVCPSIVLLTSQARWLNRPIVLVAACLLTVVGSGTEEVWLSSIGTQCYLTLCVGIILAVEAQSGRAVASFRLLLLALAALSGPGSWILLPLFAARAAIDRSSMRAWQAAVLGTGVLIQLGFFFSHDGGRRFVVQPLLLLDIVFVKYLLVAGLWQPVASNLAAHMHDLATTGHLPWWPAAAVLCIVLAYGATVVTEWRSEPFWLALAAGAVALVSLVGVLGNLEDNLSTWYGERYAVAPQVLLALSVIGVAATHKHLSRTIATVWVVWTMMIGASGYFSPSFAFFAHGPGWRDELALHRRDPSHVIASWPPGWIVPLPR